jgi:KDO2-lipid IV(A) lauroyltransferase
MNNLFYWGVLYPISKLPYKLLYCFRPLLYFILFILIGYRKKVVSENLKNSFPQDSEQERKKKMKGFYWHLTTLIIEAVLNLHFSAKQLQARMIFRNPELLTNLQKEKRNIILVGGHYGNWEWLITSLGIHFPTHLYGLGMPLSASYWQKKLTERRERFGLNVIHSKNYRDYLLNEDNHPFLLLMLADQSPGDSRKSYWMNFLHQPTAIALGSETLANETQACVVYCHVLKSTNGRYEVAFEVLTHTPNSLPYGAITESYTQRLEAAIVKDPSLWLWSHKRWKREVPENIIALHREQEERFNAKYRL